jgi:hypothetical protein
MAFRMDDIPASMLELSREESTPLLPHTRGNSHSAGHRVSPEVLGARITLHTVEMLLPMGLSEPTSWTAAGKPV